MVLKSASVVDCPLVKMVSHEESYIGNPVSPIDLSNKHMHSPSSETPRHLSARSPFISIVPSTTVRPTSSPRFSLYQNNNNNINKNNNIVLKCKAPSLFHSEEKQFNSTHQKGESRRPRKSELINEVGWVQTRNEEEPNSYSSTDSDHHGSSPGEEEDGTSSKDATPPHSNHVQNIHNGSYIPLNFIRERYHHQRTTSKTEEPEDQFLINEDENSVSPKKSGRNRDKVVDKINRLEKMVTHITHIKSSKDNRSRKNSGDDDTSSGGHSGHLTSGDDFGEYAPTDLRNSSFQQCIATKENGGCLNLKRKCLNDEDGVEIEENEPRKLVCSKNRSRNRTEDLQREAWKPNFNNKSSQKPNINPFSPAEAPNPLGVDAADVYQQQHILQMQLALLRDPEALLKAMAMGNPMNIPPAFTYYYLQYIQTQAAQAHELYRQQFATQSFPVTPNISQGDKSPSVPRTSGSSGFCHSPLSPVSSSKSEGLGGLDSEGSVVGQSTPGSANNGKRAPRAMTGRHVRTGTGASAAVLLTLKNKILEKQRRNAQQASNNQLNQPNSKNKSKNFVKKPSNKK